MSTHASKRAVRLIHKCMWQGGGEDLFKSSFRENLRNSRHCAAATGLTTKRNQSTVSSLHNERVPHSNPMLNGMPMLQWFFDEVRPDQREVRYWMKYFSEVTDPSKPFAVVQITEDVFRQEQQDQDAKRNGDIRRRTILETLSLSMYFLQQNKMNVVLLVGSSKPSMIEGCTQKKIREEIYKNIKTLVDRFEECGTRTTPMFDGGHLFNTDTQFRIESVNTEHLDWMTSHVNSIPVIACIGESGDGRLGLVQLDDGAHALSAYTKPLKVLLLNATGGINDHKGQKVTTVFLPKESELQKFVNQPWWNEDVADRFGRVCDILKVLPKKSSYVITSASDLLSELLTQRGVGTMFKKVVPVKRYSSLEDTVNIGDKQNGGKKLSHILPNLVEKSFDRKLSSDYWEELPDTLESIYITYDLKSCAIVRSLPSMPGIYYLDKFAVSKEERGNFNSEILWQQLKHDYKNLFWRSRSNNIFNSWYEARSDGIVKLDYYHVFWYGMSAKDLNELIKQCETLPDSFVDDGVKVAAKRVQR